MSARDYGEVASDASAGREQQAVNRSGRQKISAPRISHEAERTRNPRCLLGIKMSQVAIKRCKDYNTENMQRAVEEAVGLLGGIEKFVKLGQKVLIKPNLLSPRPPEHGVCTHPEVIRAVIRLVKKVTQDISVGDSHGGFEVISMDNVYEVSGMKAVCAEEGVKLVKFDTAVNIDGIPFAKAVKDADVIINVPKMKTHGLLILTGAVKNMFGAVIGKHKAEAHFKHIARQDFASYIIKIFMHVKPVLSIMDGIVAMEGDGPAAGSLRNVELILASDDAVAMDVVFSELAGVTPESLLTTYYAGKMGLGTSSLSGIKISGEALRDVRLKDFKLPKASFIYDAPRWVIKIFGRSVRTYPFIKVDACVKCRICEKNCPAEAINIDKNEIDYSKCIFCFCCHELCPHNAIGVRKSLAGKIAGFILKVRQRKKNGD